MPACPGPWRLSAGMLSDALRLDREIAAMHLNWLPSALAASRFVRAGWQGHESIQQTQTLGQAL